MSSVAKRVAVGGIEARKISPGRRAAKLAGRWLIPVYVFLALFYLALPILVMIAFSFNDPPGRFVRVIRRIAIRRQSARNGPTGSLTVFRKVQ